MGRRSLFGLCLLLGLLRAGRALQNVTAQLFGAEAFGTLAAFGDFNSDKQTDLFVLRGGDELLIFLADQKEPYFKPKVKMSMKSQSIIITSVVPGDYDGDSQMDVLLTTKPKNHVTDELSVIIFWGHNQTLHTDHKTELNKTFHDEPLIMDFNGDLIPDVFGVTSESDGPQVLIGRNLSWHPVLDPKIKMCIPHSHAFIDLDSDFTADLFLTTLSKSQNIQFETWVNKDGNFSKAIEIKEKPEDMMIIGQSVFADFDGDGKTEHLLPACADEACQKSAIYLSKPGLNQWIPVLQDFRNKDTLWGFVPYKNNLSSNELSVPITLHIGDYNMDGYPDALAILRNTSGSNQQAFLLENVQCKNASCKSIHRMFKVYWELSDLNQIKDAVVATFFDIYEDGILDIIILSKSYFNNDLVIHTLKNNFEVDAYFVKVIVLSGLCSNDCPCKIPPFGVNQPGPYIMYTTVDANGYMKNGSVSFEDFTDFFPLCSHTLRETLLYSLLGEKSHFLLKTNIVEPEPINSKYKDSGPTLDFETADIYLDSLANQHILLFSCLTMCLVWDAVLIFLITCMLAFLVLWEKKSIRKQEWTAIIPNSQLIVIPYPHNVPRSWSAKLYLTPSNIVLLTAIALIGVCVFILTIIGILHWQEKKADDREKRQEAHRFHFDAM